MGFITDTVAKAGGGIGAPIPRTTLRAVPPQKLLPPSTSDMLGNKLSGPGLSVHSAIRFNVMDELSASVAPTNSSAPAVGEAGSANNAGNIAGASGNLGYFVDTARNFQAANPMIGTILRIGLPVGGIFLMTKGQYVIGGALVVASAPLWYARFKG